MHIEILYRDEQILVINKPTGVATHAPQGDLALTDVERALRAQLQLEYLAIHQRLDRDTSGVMLFALDPAANANLATAFAEHTIEKTYQALVYGVPIQTQGVIDAALAPAGDGMIQVASAHDRRAQSAITHYRVLVSSPDQRFSLLELQPKTGRTHQLRVHCECLGHPIVGDPLYDVARAAPRLMLHASELRFTHPLTQQPLHIQAPTPALFTRVAQGLPELQQSTELAALNGLIELAAERRAVLAADPATTIFRVFHGPSDGLTHPWLQHWTVDKLDQVLIASCYDEHVRQVPASLINALVAQWQPQAIYAKYRPRAAAKVDEAAMAELAPTRPVWGEPIEQVVVQEAGLSYELRPNDGLSIGLYADMRETRQRVRNLLAKRQLRVLNTFAYTCGFGVAAVADAPEAIVTNLDLSRRSLDWGKINYGLNQLAVEDRQFVFGDVFDWLSRWVRQGRQFDVVILDPPSFARNRGKRWRAEEDYADLVALAVQLLPADGHLIACCNHVGLSRRQFRGQVERGMQQGRWHGTIEANYPASPLDYPAAYGESHLKIILATGQTND
ncbi:MAG TPA: RluA family pseudouridine synthase [Herpetosiphon sp.]|uniref:Pseudouridine synthase n=1 Tax=Herpetosiphon aurantiacus (strain ATCC 23779 / DSM 785 / 114-95) TaxID=316274 RepID=A9B3Z2_HERA2|nr:RluA family pseudouridine synthase [Herpetosiphon sp.]ABX06128.1 pseudouridine synthase [Herpetosiphon aurantiacus DSM 785]HBW51318.1 RluA family pseudouridine synthase [Herpetosiphon sp.]